MKYETHKDFADSLFAFCHDLANNIDNDATKYRVLCGRLYYALFHKALHDNNESSSASSLHSHIANSIISNNIKQKYTIFYRLRSWADYDINECEILADLMDKPQNLVKICQSVLKHKIKYTTIKK